MEQYIQVLTTTGRKRDATGIARAVVKERLAACVQVIGPVTSIYRWKGAIQTSKEWLCLMKTRRSVYEALERRLLELHPYEVPEILAVPIVAGSSRYMQWMHRETRAK